FWTDGAGRCRQFDDVYRGEYEFVGYRSGARESGHREFGGDARTVRIIRWSGDYTQMDLMSTFEMDVSGALALMKRESIFDLCDEIFKFIVSEHQAVFLVF